MAFDINAANALTVILTNLNIILAVEEDPKIYI